MPLAPEQIVTSTLERLRAKLLDTTLRNPLISFKHAARGRRFVRVVDELPDQLFGKLDDDKELRFKSLGVPESEPADERTIEFRRALDAAKLSDPEYLKGLEAAGADPGDKVLERLDRELRGRVRAALAMPIRPSKAAAGVEETARARGIDPSFDLPAASPKAGHAAHSDGFVQTLLYEADLDRALAALREDVRSSIEEMGVNPLFCVFGFLEWYEADGSETPLYAPLLLQPLEMDRVVQRGRWDYRVKSSGESLTVNVALAERLKADFGLILPPLAEDDTPETYWERVRGAVGRMPGWKVRRWVTVGLFSFAKIAMYRDLAPEEWGGGAALTGHGAVRKVLAAGEAAAAAESNGAAAGEATTTVHATDEDAPASAREADRVEMSVPLILDADSTQLAAIRKVLSGRDLVIEGPPGTGKSQTIANIIAAALADGKRVLFIAEKMAALNVVKDRLEKAGLGAFCFELHSNKAGRKETYAALSRRLALGKGAPVGPELNASLAELARRRDALSDVVTALGEPAGNLGCTVQALLWKVQAWRAATAELPADIDAVAVAGADALGPTEIDAALGAADRFARNRAATAAEWGSLPGSPWHGLARADLDLLACDAVVIRAGRLAEAAAKAAACADACGASTGVTPRSLGELAALGGFRAAAPGTGSRDDLVAKLADPATHAAARRLIEGRDALDGLNATLGAAMSAPRPEAKMLREAAELAGSLLPPETPAVSIDGTLTELRVAAECQHGAARALESLRTTLGPAAPPERSAAADGALAKGAVLAAACPVGLALLRTPALVLPGAAEEAERLSARVESLASKRAELAAAWTLADLPPSAKLREHARAVRAAPVPAFLSGPYRAAKALWKGLRRTPASLGKAQIAAELDALAEFKAGCEELESSAEARRLLGNRFRGIETDVGPLRGLAAWIGRVHREMGALPAEVSVRQTLLAGPPETLAAMAAWQGAAPAGLAGAVAEGAKRGLSVAGLAAETDAAVGRAGRLAEIVRGLGVGAAVRAGELASLAEAAARRDALVDDLSHPDLDRALRPVLGEGFTGSATDVAPLRASAAYVEGLRGAAPPLPPAQLAWLLEKDAAERHCTLAALAADAKTAAAGVRDALNELGAAAGADPTPWLRGASLDALDPHDLASHADRCAKAPAALQALVEDARSLRELDGMGLGPVLALLREGKVPAAAFPGACARAVYQSRARAELSKRPALISFSGDRFESERARFRELDRRLQALRSREIAERLLERPVPAGRSQGPIREWTDLALVRHLCGLQRPGMAIRRMLAQADAAVRELTPCFMMSPLSVAQYLGPKAAAFDLVVMDEASQLRPEDALGAVVRGRQVVIVGDPKQLPPTSFFAAGAAAADDEDEDARTVADEQSILDGAMTVLRPMQRLKWHYRSRHGSLIAFSNKEFYDGELVVFPSPHDRHADYGVSYTHVPEGCCRSGVNPPEAARVAAAVVEHSRTHPGRSLGVVTMNIKQAELLRLELDRLATEDAAFARWLESFEGSLEPFFVKNLENVQGDERDTIFISTVYGRNEAGQMFQRFGPINSAGGHRRLNVLFTRAKLRTAVFSSMLPTDIRVDETTAWGPRALQGFLAYAKDRSLDGAAPSGRGPDSDFERAVIGAVRGAGYEAVPQVGVVGYFIDVGVRDPGSPGRFALGVECDGATYHSSRSARDRDRLRQQVLEGLGWRIHRVWSLDWFRDPARETRRLVAAIEAAVAAG